MKHRAGTRARRAPPRPAPVQTEPVPWDEPPGADRSVHWLADYVYGTISTLVALAGLSFETNPNALTTAGYVVVGALAIWFAHGLSRLITRRAWQHLDLGWPDISNELRGSWSILSAAIPASIIFALAGIHVWSVGTAFILAEVVGVLALAVVGIGTAGGSDRPLSRRVLYVTSMVSVGIVIALLEALVHLL